MNKSKLTSIFRMVLLTAFVAAVSVTAASAQPRVLVDQGHFNQLAMSSTYPWSLSVMASELANNGYVVGSLNGSVSSATLATWDVFVITAPEFTYTSQELTALQAFVSAGGGVWLAVDYMVDNGAQTEWAAACQQLADAFGYNLDSNHATDPTHNLYNYSYWIGFDSSTLGNHEVVRGVSSLQCFSTTTLTGPVGASMLCKTYETSDPPSNELQTCPAAMAGSYGSGRVVVTGNSLYMANPNPNRNVNGQLVTMTGITAADNRQFTYQAITYLAGADARPLVSISEPVRSQMVYGTVGIKGTACDSGIVSYAMAYASASDPSVFTPISSGVESRVMETLAQWDTSLVAEGDYIIRVTATNAVGNSYSQTVEVSIKHIVQVQTIQECKSMPDGTLVSLADKVASTGSGDFAGFFYAAETNRIGGIRVNSSALPNAGDNVSVVGLMATLNGERCIDCILSP